jgi:hypothetical protein
MILAENALLIKSKSLRDVIKPGIIAVYMEIIRTVLPVKLLI